MKIKSYPIMHTKKFHYFHYYYLIVNIVKNSKYNNDKSNISNKIVKLK